MYTGATIGLPASARLAQPASHPREGKIERVDARDYRDQILALFERSGNGNFAEQFNWYYREQGYDTPVSFVLFDRSGKLSGLASVTIRNLRFGNTLVRAGVAGNLLMDRVPGVYLGAFSLVNAMKSLVRKKEIEVLLGIPNRLAEPIFSRLGFAVIDRWTTHAQVFRSRELLRFHLGMLGRMSSPIVDVCAAGRRALSHWRQAQYPGFRVIEVTENEVSHLRLKEWPAPWHRLVTDVTSDYLKCRFLQAPLRAYSIVGILSPRGEICGYLALRHTPGRIWISDCGVDRTKLSEGAAILCFCRDQQAYDGTVWVTTLRSASVSAELAYYGFVRVRESMGGYPDFPLMGYWSPDHRLAGVFVQPTSWNVFSGFNDV